MRTFWIWSQAIQSERDFNVRLIFAYVKLTRLRLPLPAAVKCSTLKSNGLTTRANHSYGVTRGNIYHELPQ